MSNPDVIAKLKQLITSVERAVHYAYSGSAEHGSFLRNGGGEYTPCVFMKLDELRDALALLTDETPETERTFPIMDGPDIPWRLIEPFENMARRNHGDQSLQTLSNRGGLAMVEALPILNGQSYHEFWTARLGKRYPSKDDPPHAEVLREFMALIAERSATAAPLPSAQEKAERCFQCDGDGMIGIHNCPRCGGGGKEA